MYKKSTLLHSCCAPCLAYVYELLNDGYNIKVFYFNPNIYPTDEYNIRLEELKRFSEMKGFSLLIGVYNNEMWHDRIEPLKYLGEKSERCWECYSIRLEETFRKAMDLKVDNVATTLSISPLKDAVMINEIGKELERKYGIEFITADFKKKDGYKRSVELSNEYGFYRQNYCGCSYSKLEREKDPSWQKEKEEYMKSHGPIN